MNSIEKRARPSGEAATTIAGLSSRTGPAMEFTQGVAIPILAPAISGFPMEGETLTSSAGNWNFPVTTISYRWKQRGFDIVGADGPVYVLDEDDVGEEITSSVTVGNEAGPGTAVDSLPMAIAYEPFEPSNLAAPEIEGAARVGQVLTVSGGLWNYNPVSFKYQWYADGIAIPDGADTFSYELSAADAGKNIAAAVVAANREGDSLPSFSAAIGPVV